LSGDAEWLHSQQTLLMQANAVGAVMGAGNAKGN
jgi:hypothetical protein